MANDSKTVASVSVETERQSRPMVGIVFKVISVVFFLCMVTLLKASSGIPVGQMAFFRTFFAIAPIIVFLKYRGELKTAFHTKRPWAHLRRGLLGVVGMFLGFYAITQLPISEAVAIQYSAPLMMVILGAVVLKETVRVYRWSAVFAGLVGVMIILWPRLTVFASGELSSGVALGALAATLAACVMAVASLIIRDLVKTETSATIVLYFSVISSIIALSTVFFGWVWPTPQQIMYLIGAGVLGGIAQVLLTESYRHADLSVIAPFEYVSLPLSIVIGVLLFADTPTMSLLIGGGIVVSAGIFIIYREHQLGLERGKARKVSTPLG